METYSFEGTVAILILLVILSFKKLMALPLSTKARTSSPLIRAHMVLEPLVEA